MTDLTFLQEYAVPVIVGICLCIGYIIKNLVPSEKINKFIPLIMGVLGVVINFWINHIMTPTILLGGLFSGLASTGLYEAFRNLISLKSDT
ncbi:MAG: phage holin family protein [Pseudobutyrivibrio sp.]|nr:phage holin family protein [Pseudobutyrivibrio sp.]